MASLRDVAKSAGVSIATVSNVLNGHSEKVSPETRERVLASVRKLRYRPTPLEHNQKAISSQNLGVVVPDFALGTLHNNRYFRDILDGVLEGAGAKGWSITIFLQNVWADVGLTVRRSYDGRCDGLIIVAPQPGHELVQTLYERGTPVVLVGSTPWLSNISLVDVDNASVGAQAVQHLVALNHRRLAYVGHEKEQVSSIERREAFFAEALRAGIPREDIHWISIPRMESEEAVGRAAVQQLLSLRHPPTGLLCWHDGLATHVVRELKRSNLTVPGQVSVVSVDDAEEAALCDPPLTTFRNPLVEIGKRAAKMLIEKLTEANDATEFVRFGPELIVRQSTGPAPE